MSDEKQEHTKPEGARNAHTITLAGVEHSYMSEADWLVLRTDEKPVAEMFYVFYALADDTERRPLTIVFNGGPGAASAYLHVGALGPQCVSFNPDGTAPAPPVELRDNPESWLAFTDLVFVDPVGTGFSRAIPQDDEDDAKKPKSSSESAKAFWKIDRDLHALGEFISKFLSIKHRWDSPIFIAGESYGGFRTAKLARLAQETYGVGLNGAVLISPALEFALLDASDYDLLPWIDVLPSMAAAAAYHGKASAFPESTDLAAVLAKAEDLATKTAPALLLGGDSLSQRERNRLAAQLARYIGIDREIVARGGGRIGAARFARELLRDEGLVCGLYDATVTTSDPYPDRDSFGGPDPTLRAIERVFAAGINTHLRRNLGLLTDRDYHLLSMEVNKGWQVDLERHALESQIGATDDLRYAMSLNPHMRVRITHGVYDLVTPYFSSNRIARLMRLPERSRANLSLVHYPGGHMFYAWEASRTAFARDMREFYRAATGERR
ncbi:MAG: S10 family peptidase [Spirochaetota bacterium]